jgi:hypothetical protein
LTRRRPGHIGGRCRRQIQQPHGDAIELEFQPTDRSRAELAARLLKLAGVGAEVKKVSDRDVRYVKAATDKLAAGRKELRDALANIVREDIARGWIDAGKAGWRS